MACPAVVSNRKIHVANWLFGIVTTGNRMSDGDFDPEGWSAFDDHGAHGEKGNAGCAIFFIVIAVVVIIGRISGC